MPRIEGLCCFWCVSGTTPALSVLLDLPWKLTVPGEPRTSPGGGCWRFYDNISSGGHDLGASAFSWSDVSTYNTNMAGQMATCDGNAQCQGITTMVTQQGAQFETTVWPLAWAKVSLNASQRGFRKEGGIEREWDSKP
jgi:hypothetical protein